MIKYRFVNIILIIAICFGVTYSLFHGYLFIWEPRLFELERKDLHISDYDKLLKFKYSSYKVINFIKNNTSYESIILVLRVSDIAYYAERKFIAHTDERLSDFYKIKSKKIAFNFLKKMNIDYLFMPDYSLPTFYNSQLYRIVSDPNFSEIVYESGGYRLYKLIEKNNNVIVKKPLFQFPQTDERIHADWTFSAGDTVSLIDSAAADKHIELKSGITDMVLYSGAGFPEAPPGARSGQIDKIKEGARYVFKADIAGNGYFKAFFIIYFSDGGAREISLWESVIRQNKLIESQFIAPAGSREFRLKFLLQKGGAITIRDIAINEIVAGGDKQLPDKPRKLAHWGLRNIPPDQLVPRFDPSVNYSSVPSNRDTIHVKQPNTARSVLYTGPGDILDPPSERLDFQWLNKSSLYLLRAFLKGKGRLGLFVWWYDQYGRAFNELLDTYRLTSEFQPIAAKIRLPKYAVEFRIAFINTNDEPSSLKSSGFSEVYLRDAKLNNTMENDGPDNKFIWKTVYNSGSQNAGSDTVLPSTHSISIITDTKDFGWSTYSDGNVVSLITGAVKRAFRYFGGSTYSDEHEVSMPWAGVIMEDAEGKPSYFIKQAKQWDNYWLYSGLGQIHYPPSYSYDEQWRTEGKGLHRVQASIKGAGAAELYIWWYDLLGNVFDRHIGKYYLSTEYKRIEQTFELPREAAEYRIAFLMRKDPEAFPQDGNHQHPELIISDVAIDRAENSVELKRSIVWKQLVAVDADTLTQGGDKKIEWGTYSGGRDALWQWGLKREGTEGKSAFMLKQSDRESDFWLYTGTGQLQHPPSRFHDEQWKNKGTGLHRVQAVVRGKGSVELCVRMYDRFGNSKDVRIGSYQLAAENNTLTQLFELPETATEYRIAFILKKPGVHFSLSRSFLKELVNYLLWRPKEIYISSLTIDRRNTPYITSRLSEPRKIDRREETGVLVRSQRLPFLNPVYTLL